MLYPKKTEGTEETNEITHISFNVGSTIYTFSKGTMEKQGNTVVLTLDNSPAENFPPKLPFIGGFTETADNSE